ncbi:MAG: hypothetical protein RDO_0480 [Flavobacteriales endosymbiont of Rhyzopertha dominica]|nr:MAG: crossover junction endodeoxyribonuclease RuvC [Candidatus Shikimatogenerans bostrichidophilus]
MLIINKKKIFLGIDPGINIIGISIIKFYNNKIKILYIKEINLKNIKYLYKKLKIINFIINKIITIYKPNLVLIESNFLGKNVKTLKRLIQCQFCILLNIINNNINYIEISPKIIKYIITGNGNCKKYNIKNKLKYFLNNFNFNYSLNYDYIDSIAIIITYIFLNYKLI